MDEQQTVAAFELAMQTQKPEFENFFLARFLGMSFEYPDETCLISFDVKEFMFNPQGTVHGGIIATVMDISMGHLLKRFGITGTTLEMKTQYVKAVRAGRLQCRGEVVRRGRTISFLKSTLMDEDGTVLAVATATWMALKQE
ncbi:PaaI family thioesterase [Orrella sp. 11846]|uniref:PaaI family thioesterase n=1 Tax=Orrella sp. 11846 TaxID=3409913 RepID=UPI003B595E73